MSSLYPPPPPPFPASVPAPYVVNNPQERLALATQALQQFAPTPPATPVVVDASGKVGNNKKQKEKTALQLAQEATAQSTQRLDDIQKRAENAYIDNSQKLLAQDALMQRKEQDRQNAIDATHQEVKALQKEAADARINPDRVMQKTSNKVMATIGMALGAFGAAFTGGPNYAYQIIQNRIQNDIDAQKEDLANKRYSVQSKQNEMGVMLQRYGDERQAENAAYIRMSQDYVNQLEMFGQQTSNEQAKAHINNLVVQLKDGIDARAQQWAMHKESLAAQARADAERNRIAMLGVQADFAKLAQEQDKKTQQQNVPGLTVKQGYVPSEADKKKAQEIYANAAAAMDAVNAYKKAYNAYRNSNAISSPEISAAVDQARDRLVSVLPRALGMGSNPTDADFERIAKIIGEDPRSFSPFTSNRYQDAFLARITDAVNGPLRDQLATYGYEVGNSPASLGFKPNE